MLTEHSAFEAQEHLQKGLPETFQPGKVKLAIICGSGLGGLVQTLDPSTCVTFDYESIPGFSASTVVGHAGKLVFGLLGKSKTPTMCMVGRFHFYEGHSTLQCTFPIRLMHLFGVETLIVTNASGGLNPLYKVGDIMVISDHISLPGLTGNNPLIGRNWDTFGPRFPPTSDAYPVALRKMLIDAAIASNFPLEAIREGVYVMVTGPSYETKAEARYLRSIGADAVGMSTVPEVVVARHCGMKTLGISLITNSVVTNPGRSALNEVLVELGIEKDRRDEADTELYVASHEEVLETAAMRAEQLQTIVTKVVDLLAAERNNAPVQ